MLSRYGTDDRGRRKKLARIYTTEEHGITRGRIAPEAYAVTRRLSQAGYPAYIVGGAVRDLLLGKTPKDYDIATEAHPRDVRKLFRRSRIIGRRFQLVHVYVQDTIIEVSTFRAPPGEDPVEDAREANNLFGSMADDVRRRDFTMNALYYDPAAEQIIDYSGGFEDIRAGRIKALVAPEDSFVDDPVRMIRAVRYAATTGFRMPGKYVRTIRKVGAKIIGCPASRLTEELFKILACGASAEFFRSARECELLDYLLPEVAARIDDVTNTLEGALMASLGKLDEIVASGTTEKSVMIEHLCNPLLTIDLASGPDPDLFAGELFKACKALVAPLTPPNAEVDRAVKAIMKERGYTPPSKRRRKPRRRNRPATE